MTTWTCSRKHYVATPATLEGSDDDVIAKMTALALDKNITALETESYGDQIDFFFRQRGKRYVFATYMME